MSDGTPMSLNERKELTQQVLESKAKKSTNPHEYKTQTYVRLKKETGLERLRTEVIEDLLAQLDEQI